MVDDIIDLGGDVEIKKSFQTVLGLDNGTRVFDAVMKNNPSFAPDITRLQVFDAIAAECEKQQIYVHLDNHVSKAGWCCALNDGNGWFGDQYFDVEKWKRALGFMADHVSNDATKNWWNLEHRRLILAHRESPGRISSVWGFGMNCVNRVSRWILGRRGTTV